MLIHNVSNRTQIQSRGRLVIMCDVITLLPVCVHHVLGELLSLTQQVLDGGLSLSSLSLESCSGIGQLLSHNPTATHNKSTGVRLRIVLRKKKRGERERERE